MKPTLRTAIISGGILNFLLTLFHIFLCYRIAQVYSTQPSYPLMQMLAIGGALMIGFLSWTSLAYRDELVQTKLGSAIVVLNILVYGLRVVEEFVLSQRISYPIVGVCLLITATYLYIFVASRTIQIGDESAQAKAAAS